MWTTATNVFGNTPTNFISAAPTAKMPVRSSTSVKSVIRAYPMAVLANAPATTLREALSHKAASLPPRMRNGHIGSQLEMPMSKKAHLQGTRSLPKGRREQNLDDGSGNPHHATDLGHAYSPELVGDHRHDQSRARHACRDNARCNYDLEHIRLSVQGPQGIHGCSGRAGRGAHRSTLKPK
mmetsp:Transcript_9370/g.29045  ORF Transcript_9370/g.29045 Transcript_9370/m.29045 type:complete len:181 (+) Transcript_9370:1340-1882(+)